MKNKAIVSTNPFTRDFGTVNHSYITRIKMRDEIFRSFVYGITDDKAYFIIGQRGFGKSSFLRFAKKEIEKEKGWVIVELRANNSDLIHEFAASLFAIPVLNARLDEELHHNLNSYVYSTIWDELSPVEKDIIGIMATHSLSKVKDIREKYTESFPERKELTSSNFSKYRDTLLKQDILKSPSNTILEFALPGFDRYVSFMQP